MEGVFSPLVSAPPQPQPHSNLDSVRPLRVLVMFSLSPVASACLDLLSCETGSPNSTYLGRAVRETLHLSPSLLNSFSAHPCLVTPVVTKQRLTLPLLVFGAPILSSLRHRLSSLASRMLTLCDFPAQSLLLLLHVPGISIFVPFLASLLSL